MWAVPKKTFLSFAVALFTSVLVGGLFLPAQTAALDVPNAITSTPILFAEEAVETDQVDCQGGGMSWLFCGLIEGFAAAADFLINFLIVPLLRTTPIDLSNPNSAIFQIWSSIRVVASVLMVIVLFVLVIGQAVGNDYASAYAVKKTLPRLLVALVLINISIYLVAGLVDIFNIIGMSIGQLMMAPFADSGNVVFEIGAGASTIVSIAGLVGGVWAITSFSLAGLQLVMLTVLLPLVLAIVAVFATLVIRQGIILLLIILAPIAFAMYALPNTEQYFQKWWSMFVKTLVVFPVVVAVLTLSNIMVITTSAANQDSNVAAKAIAGLVGLVLMAIPLFIIPFAFQLAGGIIGTIASKGAGFGKGFATKVQGDARDPNSRLARLRSNARDGAIRNRGRKIDGLNGISASTSSGVIGSRVGRSRLGRGLADRSARLLNYGDIEAQRSALTKQEGEIRELKSNYGPDTSIRALFAKKEVGENGVVQYRSIMDPSKTYTPAQHAKARSLYGKNLSSMQTALDYEIGKASNTEQYNRLRDTAAAHISGELGFSPDETKEALIGVNYKNSGFHLSGKHEKHAYNEDTKEWTRTVNASALSTEVAQKKGAGAQSNFSEATWRDMEQNERILKGAEAIIAGMTGSSDEAINAALKDAGYKDHGLESIEKIQATRQNHTRIATSIQTTGRGNDEEGNPVGMSYAPADVQAAMNDFAASVLGTTPPGPAPGP